MSATVRDPIRSDADAMPVQQRRLWLAVRRALLLIVRAIEDECGIEPSRN